MKRFEPYELRREFSRRVDEKRHRDFERSEKRTRKEDTAKIEDTAEEELMAVAQAAIEATAESLAQFEEQLTHYEKLTVEQITALQDKLVQLAEVRAELFENAHMLPDGRRVFKTEDGQSVFDEYGVQLSREEIDPALISDEKTRWEAILRIDATIAQTQQQLDEVFEFQDELDGMRDRYNEGDLTAGELEDLEQRLERSVPTSIRIRQTALEAGGEPTRVTPDFLVAAANKVNLDSLEVSSPGLGS